jgi:hypothetical protein
MLVLLTPWLLAMLGCWVVYALTVCLRWRVAVVCLVVCMLAGGHVMACCSSAIMPVVRLCVEGVWWFGAKEGHFLACTPFLATGFRVCPVVVHRMHGCCLHCGLDRVSLTLMPFKNGMSASAAIRLGVRAWFLLQQCITSGAATTAGMTSD